MKGYKAEYQGVEMQEALNLVEALKDVDYKQRNCLMLLTEEMYSMMSNVLSHKQANFEIVRNGEEFSLSIKVRAEVNEKARQEYLSMSTDGKNLAYKGLRGKMTALFEAMAYSAAVDPLCQYGFASDNSYYSGLWSMSQYMKEATAEEQKLDWDGMEKSVIATFADDVLIGVRDDQVEMVVKRKF